MNHPSAPTAEQILDLIDEPFLLLHPDGRIVAANAPAAHQLGVPSPDLTGRDLAELVVSSWSDAAVFLRRAAGTREATIGALTLRRADGSRLAARCHANLLRPARTGEPALLALRCRPRVAALSPFLHLNRQLDQANREITRRREAERRLHELNEHLESRVREAVAAHERAQGLLAQAQRLEALGKLAAGIAHDFNNVLQAVSGALGLIRRRAGDPARVRHFAGLGLDAADRGAAITGRMLAFARQGAVRAEAVDAGPLLVALLEMLAPTLGPAITVATSIAPRTPHLLADKSQLETVLVNLAINARDAMPGGGKLTITVMPDTIDADAAHPAALAPGEYVCVAVADTGLGMDAATLARASEPFFTTKPIGQGTGLGLSMARGFAQQSGGGLAISSAAGRGTRVSVWFPPARAGAVPEPSGGPTGSPETIAACILLVDDDPLARQVLAGQLSERGHRVVQAAGGLAALEWLEGAEPVDLLVTDFAMPGMTGLALIEQVRRRRPTLPVILLTGYAEPALAAAAGADTVLLRKPIGGEELGRRAASLIAAAPRAPHYTNS